ncbi:MAG: hypothetical protein ACP5PZ_06910 [Bacteroidales bacterium]
METNMTENAATRMELDEISISYLVAIHKWAYFFAILGFVGIAILLLIGILSKTILGIVNPELGAAATIMGFIYVLLALIYFFPVIYLYRFARLTKKAIQQSNNLLMQEALLNFKKHYQFIGVVTISILVMYLVIIFGYGLGKIFLG